MRSMMDLLLPASYFPRPASYFLLPTSYFLLPTSYFLLTYCLLLTSRGSMMSHALAEAKKNERSHDLVRARFRVRVGVRVRVRVG